MSHPLVHRFPDRNPSLRVFFHPDCLLHDGPADHPECPERLEAILDGCMKLPKKTAVSFVIPPPASFDQLLLAHDKNYLTRLEEAPYTSSVFMSNDNYVCQDSFDAIRASAGCAAAAGELLAKGQSSFALTRPPGHHARRDGAEGFCFVNNVVLAAEIVRRAHPTAQVLIVDFDVHHGNGIDHYYHHNDQVLYYSIHGNPMHIYPNSGFPDETGIGKGRGRTRNITLEEGTDGKRWLELFESSLRSFVSMYQPQFLLVSAGFDAHEKDPFSVMKLQDRDYLQAVRLLKQIAKDHCNDASAWFLEGGYSTDVLKRLVPKVISELA